MGAFYSDHLAYVFVLGAFAVSRSPGFLTSYKLSRILASSFLFMLAYYTKQTVGALGLAAFVGVELAFARSGLRWAAKFLIAHFIWHLLFLAGVACFSNLTPFLWATFQQPFSLLFRPDIKPEKSVQRLLTWLLVPWGVNPMTAIAERGWGRLSFYPVVLGVYAIFIWLGLSYRGCFTQNRFRSWGTCAFLLLSTLWCGALLGRSHTHLFFGMAGATAIALAHANVRQVSAGIFVLGLALGLANVILIIPPSPGSHSTQQADGNNGLYPIEIVDSAGLSASGDVIGYLRSRPGSLASLVPGTQLVPLTLQRPMLNPTLYYEAYLTIPFQTISGMAHWETNNIAAIDDKKVRYLIVKCLDIPSEFTSRTSRYLQENYRLVFEGRDLQVLERCNANPCLGAPWQCNPMKKMGAP